MNTFSISIDTDWVSDDVLQFTIDLINRFGIQATFFCTNQTDCDFNKHEIAIHPNFTSLDFNRHIDEMLSIFPMAKGIRSHSLFYSERMRPIFYQKGIEYTSNYMLFEHKNLTPCMVSPTVIELPIFFMDTFNLIMKGPKANFATDVDKLTEVGLKVYDFHPIHVYMNTYSFEHYEEFKHEYKNSAKLKTYINTKYYGIRNYLEDLLLYIVTNKMHHETLGNLSIQYRKANYAGNINR